MTARRRARDDERLEAPMIRDFFIAVLDGMGFGLGVLIIVAVVDLISWWGSDK
jgi:hypothetical protein